jgi:hypothetical protein
VLQLLPNIEELKTHSELIKYVCDVIEKMVKPKHKIDKLKLLLFTLKRLVNLTPDEEELITSTVQFLHDNKLIVGMTKLQKSIKFASKFFSK